MQGKIERRHFATQNTVGSARLAILTVLLSISNVLDKINTFFDRKSFRVCDDVLCEAMSLILKSTWDTIQIRQVLERVADLALSSLR